MIYESFAQSKKRYHRSAPLSVHSSATVLSFLQHKAPSPHLCPLLACLRKSLLCQCNCKPVVQRRRISVTARHQLSCCRDIKASVTDAGFIVHNKTNPFPLHRSQRGIIQSEGNDLILVASQDSSCTNESFAEVCIFPRWRYGSLQCGDDEGRGCNRLKSFHCISGDGWRRHTAADKTIRVLWVEDEVSLPPCVHCII